MAFCGYLKLSTAVTLSIGPFIDDTDGKTAKTALTLAQADFRLSKNGGAQAAKSSATSATHDALGYYLTPFDTTDTATLGLLTISVHKSSGLPVRQDYIVVPANIYNAWVLSTNLQNVNMDQISVSASDGTSGGDAARNLGKSASLMYQDTVTNAGFTTTATEFEAATIATATSSHWVGRRVYFLTGTLQYQGSKITAYSLVGGRGHFTVETLTSIPANGVAFEII